MLQSLAAKAALLRHWKIAAAGLVLLFGTWSCGEKLRAERALERCRGEAALAAERLDRANSAARALRRDSERRAAEQARLLAHARREQAGEQPRIDRLKRSAAEPRASGQCAVSEALRDSEDRL